MKSSDRVDCTQNRSHRLSLLAVASLAIAGVAAAAALAQQGTAPPKAAPSAEKVQLMFVQTSDDFKADPAAKTLRLVNVNQQTLYFSDRPVRVAGNLTMPAYLDEWKAGEGPDNFAADPPNATLSVYEPGHKDNVLAVVEISHPVVDGKDLVYSYKLIDGVMPKSGGAAALFIDWIGVGGGVGPGFHGVGAGTRGVGLTGGYGGPRR